MNFSSQLQQLDANCLFNFEIRTNSRHFLQNILKSEQKCPYLELSGFQMVGTFAIAEAQPKKAKARPFETQNI